MESVKVATGPFLTHLHRAGEGEAVLFIHGSGPGATGLSNWQLALPELGRDFLCLAPDLVGYGESTHPEPPPRGARAWMRLWVDQLLGLLDALGLERAHLVGNSLGGPSPSTSSWRPRSASGGWSSWGLWGAFPPDPGAGPHLGLLRGPHLKRHEERHPLVRL